MSHYPGGPPPPYFGWQPQGPYPHDGGQLTHPQHGPNHHGPHHHGPHHHGPHHHGPTHHPYPIYVPGTMMVPVPIPPHPDQQPTFITNYIYNGESSAPSSQLADLSDFDWVPSTATTASHLTGRAVIGGHEGWDGSPLWVIRAWHSGDLIPGKLSVRHCKATVMYDGKEIPVQNIEVLCASQERLKWVPASNGAVPPGAVNGGRTSSGETLYVGRAHYQLSVTPGKVHPSHGKCYIGFCGSEIAQEAYDVLCRF